MTKSYPSYVRTVLRTLVVPVAVLACAFIFAALGWFEKPRVVVGYSVAALLTLLRWRKCTYALEPSIRCVAWKQLDASSSRAIKRGFLFIFGAAVAVYVFLLLWLVLTPFPRTTTTLTIVLFTMGWVSIVKFGLINLCVYVLAHL